jgi:hypothetical protein
VRYVVESTMTSVARVVIVVLGALAITGMVAQAGSVPHLHVGTEAGFFNEEHDLTLLAGLASTVVSVDAAPVLAIGSDSSPLVLSAPERPVLRAADTGLSRAPPLA